MAIKRAAVLACLAVLTAGFFAGTAWGAETQPVTVQILETEDPEGNFDTGSPADFFAKVTVGSSATVESPHQSFPPEFATGFIFPWIVTTSWILTGYDDPLDGTATVKIDLLDDDSGLAFRDDDADIKPGNGERLELTIDLASGAISGDVAATVGTPFDAAGTGDDRARIRLLVTLVDPADADLDGLEDTWETNGHDGLSLAALGANPQRKDLFLEIDCLADDANNDGNFTGAADHNHCPTSASVQTVVRAFANAPVANPDGTTGIQLHVDVGPQFGIGTVNSVAGNGGVTGTFGDLGGGGQLFDEAGRTVMSLNPNSPKPDLWDVKSMAANRADVFRYALFAHQVDAREANGDCTSGHGEWSNGKGGNDFFVSLGGRRDLNGDGVFDTTCWAEGPLNGIDDDGDGTVDEDPAGGGDTDGDCTADSNGDGVMCGSGDVGVDEDGGYSIGNSTQFAGTLMHEFGHTLGLGHGGVDALNDKPNYFSVMNYRDLLSLVGQGGGGAQFCGVPTNTGGSVTLPGGCDYSRVDVDLTEPAPGIDECLGVDGGGFLNFGSLNLDASTTPLFSGATCVPASANLVDVDVNTTGTIEDLPGHEDWNNLFYRFQTRSNFVDRAAGSAVGNAVDFRPQDLRAVQASTEAQTAPALTLDIDAPNAAPNGTTVTATLDIGNDGRGPAFRINGGLTGPSGGAIVTVSQPQLIVGQISSRSGTYTIPADACPSVLTFSAKADGLGLSLLGHEATAQHQLQVLDVTAPDIAVTLDPNTLWSPDHKLRTIAATIVAKDRCDANPDVRLVSITSNQPENAPGDGSTGPDIDGAALGTDDRSFRVRAERTGSQTRVYTVVYSATDDSGNVGLRSAKVTVPGNQR